MAGRAFVPGEVLDKGSITLRGKFTVGASGASTLVAASSQGISSITKSATGRYLITLQDAYQRVMDVDLIGVGTTVADFNAWLYDDSVTTKTLKLSTLTAGVETEPASGAAFLFQIVLKNSTVI